MIRYARLILDAILGVLRMDYKGPGLLVMFAPERTEYSVELSCPGESTRVFTSGNATWPWPLAPGIENPFSQHDN
jgi:hypothetical protein